MALAVMCPPSGMPAMSGFPALWQAVVIQLDTTSSSCVVCPACSFERVPSSKPQAPAGRPELPATMVAMRRSWPPAFTISACSWAPTLLSPFGSTLVSSRAVSR